MSSWNKKKRKRGSGGWKSNKSPPSKKRKHNDNNDKLERSSNINLWSDYKACLSWLVSSDNNDNLMDFLTNYLHKKPYLVQRNNSNYYKLKGIDIDINGVYNIIDKNDGIFHFGQNVICKYYDKKSKIETNAVSRGEIVKLDLIRNLFNDESNGATIQLLHSHFYHFEIGHLIFNLESIFGNFVSSNIYITPNKKQGLKPHWDDIDAFIIQLKGKKHWKLYSIKELNEQYPINESLDDLDINDKNKYSLIMQCTLCPGDLLYFPRGIVHFAESVDDDNNNYSLHLTISTNQKYHYGEFIKLMMNKCLDEIIKNNIEWRQNMPLNIIQSIGDDVNMKNLNKIEIKERDIFKDKIYDLLHTVKTNVFGDDDNKNKQNVLINKTMDNMAMQFVSNRYPPTKFLKPDDFMIYGDKKNKLKKEKVIEPEMVKKDELIEFIEDNNKRNIVINKESMVRLIDPNWFRIINIKNNDNDDNDDGEINNFLEHDDNDNINNNNNNLLLYFCVGNNHKTHLMEYKDDMSSDAIMAESNDKIIFSLLNKTYPKWIKVNEIKQKCKKCDIKRIYDLLFALWAEGLLETNTHK